MKVITNSTRNPFVAQTIIIPFIFATAMGLLEAAVVVYMRMIYYPQGFFFPLKPMANPVLAVELVPEAATIIMLICIGILTGKTRLQKFTGFLFCFGIWDIVYYFGLRIFTNWPESIFTWDLLFLIPVVWTGPVLAPIICSLLMILMHIESVILQNKNPSLRFKLFEWISIISGAAIVFVSFIWDYLNALTNAINQKLPETTYFGILENYQPHKFAWWIFGIGIASIGCGMLRFLLKNKKDM